MIPSVRKLYNEGYTEDKYKAFLRDLDNAHPGAVEFRVAETPVFVPASFLRQMEETCEYILQLIGEPSFKAQTEDAIPPGERTPGESDHPPFISFDFGVCRNEQGVLEPQLIELQAFPTLFAFQVLMSECYQSRLPVPESFSYLLGGYTLDSYLDLLRDMIVAQAPVEEVILLEVRPHEQKTRIDFYCTEDYLGVRPVCITELFAEGRSLYYLRDGQKTRVRRIYNRIIPDDLRASKERLGPIIDLTADWDVTWISHPQWFYRVSKYMLPLMRHPHIPPAYFLHELKQLPVDPVTKEPIPLERFVLKPLFSFAGQGVLIDVTQQDLDVISDPEHWILQRKVDYADCIETPDGPAKCEIRLMYFWKDGEARAVPANNLARLSKGKMIGTRYNKDKTWVGGSAAFFGPGEVLPAGLWPAKIRP
jgi:hypothetical protein